MNAAIDAWESRVNAFTELLPAGGSGFEVAVKDTIWVQGLRATRGSRAFADFLAPVDAVAVARLRAAGASVVGRTTNPELCFRGVTQSVLHGVTRNPFDLARVVGGSSGGSGAAVAYGAVPVALGTDGGGSIRIPASFCGVVGHKPTFGLVPVTPGFRGWETLSVVGPLARTVADARRVLDIIAGPDASDPGSLGVARRPVPAALRVAASADLGHLPVEPLVRAAFEAAVAELRAAGWAIEDAEPEPMPAARLWDAVALPEGHAADRGLLERPELIEPDTRRLLGAGAEVSAAQYLDALEERAAYIRAWARFFERYDVLLLPTMQMTAFAVGRVTPDAIDGVPIDPFFDDWCNFVIPANLTGCPATSVPCGYDADGLPIGLQVMGPIGADDWTLAVAAAWETLFADRLRWPS